MTMGLMEKKRRVLRDRPNLLLQRHCNVGVSYFLPASFSKLTFTVSNDYFGHSVFFAFELTILHPTTIDHYF